MSWTYNELGVSLGPAYTGLATVGYRVMDQAKAPGASGAILLAFTTSGVIEGGVPGDYLVPAPPPFPDQPVRIEWSADGGTNFLFSKTLDPTLLESLSAQLAALPDAVVAAAGLGAPGPDRCELFSYELGGVAETPINGRVVSLELLAQPSGEATSILETQRSTVSTGPDGYWRFYPPRGASVRLRIPQAGIDATLTVPDAASVNARTLL